MGSNNAFAKIGDSCAFYNDVMIAFAFLVADYPDHSCLDVLHGKYHNNYGNDDNCRCIFPNYVTIIFFINYLPLINLSVII